MHYLRIAPIIATESGQILADDLARLMMEVGPGTRRLPEELHEKTWALGYQLRLQEVQVLAFQEEWTG
jgi:hypothetical protein